MPTRAHAEYTRAITQEIARINPYNNQEGRIGYIWASGFLAAYLASLAAEDPYVYKRFVKHIDKLKQQSNKKP